MTTLKKSALAALVLTGLTDPARAGSTFTVPVAADAAVNFAHPFNQLGGFTYRGGLFAGLDETDSDYAFYLKFSLPQLPAGEVARRVVLRGFFTDRLGGSFAALGLERVSDDWEESTINGNAGPTDSFDVSTGALNVSGSTGRFVSADITDIAANEFTGDRTLSLFAYTIDGRFGDLNYFASREYDAAKAFRLEVTTGSPTAVPLPPAVWSGVFCLVATAAVVSRSSLNRMLRQQD